jgi:hypothetical protein
MDMHWKEGIGTMQQKLTQTDLAWSVFSGAVMLSFMSIGMFVAAAYLTPAVLHMANCAPHSEKQNLIEFLLLMGGAVTADLVALLIIRYSIRFFMSPETYSRWVQLYFASRSQVPWLYRKGSDLCFSIMMPRKLRDKARYQTVHEVYTRDHEQPI